MTKMTKKLEREMQVPDLWNQYKDKKCPICGTKMNKRKMQAITEHVAKTSYKTFWQCPRCWHVL